MRIGELARLAGVSTKTIRYYEDIDVLPKPERSVNGYREYQPEDLNRLLFVRDAQATGLTLTEISSILELRGRGESTCHHVTDLLDQHLEDLDRHIEALQKTREQLAALTNRARDLDPADCTDPNRCQTITFAASAQVPPPRAAAHVHEPPRRHGHD